MSPVSTVLAVGLDVECLERVTDAVAARADATLVVQADAPSARAWLQRGGTPPHLIVAAFREPDAWGLSALLAGACSGAAGRCSDVLLLTDVPDAALPVLITDVEGLRTVAGGSTEELTAELERVLSSWSVLAAG